MSQLTIEELRSTVPENLRKSVTAEVLNNINSIINSDPEFYIRYRDNLLSFGHVMKEGKFKMQSYLDACRYVSFKLMNMSNQEAWIKTFPDRYQYFMQKNTSAKDISSYVHAYHNTKLVNMIMEQAMIPVHILNRDLFQKALNVQAELMQTATSEKVRSDAANSILSHLKPPETKKVELDITHKDDGTMNALRLATERLVQQQKEAIQNGVQTAGQIAGGRIIEGEKV